MAALASASSWASSVLWLTSMTDRRNAMTIAAYYKIMAIIDIFVHWFEASLGSLPCVRWGSSLSHFVKLVSGVRQGGVLSPQFFALFIDDVIEELIKLNIGCRMSAVLFFRLC